MELTKNMIYLIWSPTLEDIGDHTIEISLFDGMEYTYTSFKITVSFFDVVQPGPDDEGPGAILFIIIWTAILLVIIGIVLFFVLSNKKVQEEPFAPTPEVSEEVPSKGESEPPEGERSPPEETPLSDPIAEEPEIEDNAGSMVPDMEVESDDPQQ